MEPHDGIEPTPSVWKTEVLPLYECDIGWEGRGRTFTLESQSLVTIPIRLLPNMVTAAGFEPANVCVKGI